MSQIRPPAHGSPFSSYTGPPFFPGPLRIRPGLSSTFKRGLSAQSLFPETEESAAPLVPYRIPENMLWHRLGGIPARIFFFSAVYCPVLGILTSNLPVGKGVCREAPPPVLPPVNVNNKLGDLFPVFMIFLPLLSSQFPHLYFNCFLSSEMS